MKNFISVLIAVAAAFIFSTTLHAANIAVNTLEDEAGAGETCSLREAITASITNNAFGGCVAGEAGSADTITFGVDGIFSIAINPDGSPDDNMDGDFDLFGSGGNIVIAGNGMDKTIVDGSVKDRVFHILDGEALNNMRITLKDMTIRNGSVNAEGGCIYRNKSEKFELIGVKLDNCSATYGGAAYIVGGSEARIENSIISSSKASLDGGGLYVGALPFFLVGSTVTSNEAIGDPGNPESGFGGGIFNGTAAIGPSIISSAVVENKARVGGGIFNWNTVEYAVLGTTIAKNIATVKGGGIYNGLASEMELQNVTVADNTAPAGADLGIKENTYIKIQNTIVKNSHALLCEQAQVPHTSGRLISQGHNIVVNVADCNVEALSGDVFGAPFEFGAYVNLGTPAKAYYPLPALNPAINAGDNAICAGDLLKDQIGNSRRGVCDIGAIEASCGDGVLQSDQGEVCEDGNALDGDGCSLACQLEEGAQPICGNRIIDLGEECDDGNRVDDDTCTNLCQLGVGGVRTSECGNGTVESGEACDDGNSIDGDGCTADCTAQQGRRPCNESDVSNELCCGNNVLEDMEECDDGNSTGGDGCSAICLKESDRGNSSTDSSVPAAGGCSLVITK